MQKDVTQPSQGAILTGAALDMLLISVNHIDLAEYLLAISLSKCCCTF